ncbi:MAG: hypothetical protein WAO24_04750 [Peptococcia bacterium]
MPKIKKSIALVLLAIFCLGLAIGCNKGESNQQPNPPVQKEPLDNESGNQGQQEQQPEPDVENNQQEDTGLKEGTGIFQGLIDSNSIEIKVNNMPENQAYRAFALSETAKTNLVELGLQGDELISFTYTEEEGKQPLINEIKKS